MTDDTAGILVPPPLIFLGALLLGLWLDAAAPLGWPWPSTWPAVVAAIALAGLGLAISAGNLQHSGKSEHRFQPDCPPKRLRPRGHTDFLVTRGTARPRSSTLHSRWCLAAGGRSSCSSQRCS